MDKVQTYVNEQFVIFQQRNLEDSREAQGNGDKEHEHRNEEATSRTLKGHVKNMHKKPPKLDGDVDLKGFEAWQRKYMD